MTVGRHSYIAFYPSDWIAGTSRLSRLIKSVYHDVCLYNWDKNEPMPEAELMLALLDLPEGQGEGIVNMLIETNRLVRDERGVFSPRALDEAEKAYNLWFRKSEGGKKARHSGKSDGGSDGGTPPENPNLNPTTSTEVEEKEQGKPCSQKKAAPPKTYNSVQLVEAWNAMAAANGLGQIIKLTDSRRTHLRARLDDFGEDKVREAISAIPTFPFLLGENDKGWKAGFDWFVKPDSIAKILEGEAYATNNGGKPSGWRE